MDLQACTWQGVTCSDPMASHVNQLQLPSNHLSGSLLASLSGLPYLVRLDLRSNQLSGAIPSELGSLAYLDYLNLVDNQLSGNLPSALGNLSNLTRLNLAANQLNGSLPLELGNLLRLTRLSLWSNQLTGAIPPQLGDLFYLSDLWLDDNHLSGSLPSELQTLGRLVDLDVSHNQLSGSIPTQFSGMVMLNNLDLSGNQFEGAIPPQLGTIEPLRVLDLSDNHLSGSIPPQLGNQPIIDVAPRLTTLDLSNNRLSGAIPPELANLTRLYTVNLSGNALEGEFPVELAASQLQPISFEIGYNRISSSSPLARGMLYYWDWDWEQTQTLPPTNLQAQLMSSTSVRLTWAPILYTGDGGYYEISYAAAPGGPYTVLGQTYDKTVGNYTASGLAGCTTCYFQVRTFTPVHLHNQNELWSGYTVSISMLLQPVAPTAQFSAQPTTGVAPLAVSFTNASTGDYTTTQWSFGDSGNSADAAPQHIYTTPGVYTVSMQLTGAYGSSDQVRTAYITVYEGSQAPVTPTTGGTLTYQAASGAQVSVAVPPAAVNQDTNLQYTVQPSLPGAAPTNFTFAGHSFDLTAYVEGVPQEAFQFEAQVMLTIDYLDADVEGLDESSLELLYWDATQPPSGAWVSGVCGPYQRDPGNNRLSVPICHLSRFGLFSNHYPTAVALADFQALSTPDGPGLVLEWQTVSEIDLVGFNLYRALPGQPDHGRQLNPSLISTCGASPLGGSYHFNDPTAQPGQVYLYWLELVGPHGSRFAGPFQARFGSRLYLPVMTRR